MKIFAMHLDPSEKSCRFRTTNTKDIAALVFALLCSSAIAQQKTPLTSMANEHKVEATKGLHDGNQVVDPALCRQGDRRFFYWASESNVFRFRYDPKTPILIPSDRSMNGTWRRAAKQIPAAPDPSEAEGCFLNPKRAGNVPHLTEKVQTIFRKMFDRKLEVGPGIHAFVSDSSGQLSFNASRKKRFQQAQICRDRVSGIRECLASEKKVDINDLSANRYFEIKKSSLSEAVDDDIYVVLRNDAASARSENGLLAECDFYLFGSIRINTSYRLHPEEVDKLPDFYREIISEVTLAKLKSYNWKQ